MSGVEMLKFSVNVMGHEVDSSHQENEKII